MEEIYFTPPKFTIAICTRNRYLYLRKTLECLLPLLKSSERAKVLVIDNNSNDETATFIQCFATGQESVDYISCPQIGLGFARNAALEKCDTEWLVYLDDDALVSSNWILELEKLINSEQFDAFGGVYTPWYAEGKKSWFQDEFETNIHMFPKEKKTGLLTHSYFSGGIAAYRVEPLKNVGGFPTAIGMKNKKVSYGEEIHAQRNLAIAGYKLGFSKDWKMEHLAPLKKQTITWAWKKQYALGRDFWETYSKKKNFKNLTHYSFLKLKKLTPYNDYKQLKSIRACLYKMSSISFTIGLLFGFIKK